jgi:DNA-binding CsgD family transcriptional regulator/N-acetylneuraminic acid mutarotase
MEKDIQPPITADLTGRELEILQMLSTGNSNKEIAGRLFISSNTVKVHLRNIFAKIGVTSRTEAAVYAIREGLTTTQTPIPPVPAPEAQEEAPTALPALQEVPPVIIPEPIEKKSRQRYFWIASLVTVVAAGIFGFVMTIIRPPTVATAIPESATAAAPQRWNELADLPTARSGLAVAGYENQIYAIGGETSEGVTGVVECYDLTADTWGTLTPKPLPVTDVNAAVVGGEIYIPGGRLASGGVTDVLESYDPSGNHWQKRASVPVAISGYALVAFEGKLYIFGGWDGKKFLDSVYEYDPDQNQWRERTPMPTVRGFAGAAVAGGKIYVIGGRDGKGTLAVNEEYLPGHDTWLQRAPLPEGRYALGMTSVADILYIIGGEGETNSALLPLQYVPQQDQWQAFESPFSGSWSRLGVIPTGTHLYALGGSLGEVPMTKNLAYQAIYTILIPAIH